MIIYFDTSALMKLFVTEQHSEVTQRFAAESARVVVSQITWVEMCAGLALKQRTRQVNADISATALDQLRLEWPRYLRLAIDDHLTAEAGDLAQRFGLRAYDGIQLASAQRAHRQLGRNLLFCCFDKQLNAAATALGVGVAPLG